MMAMHWSPDRRRRLERTLLDHYLATLVAHGVQSYDRRALDEDYRLSVLFQILIPVRQAAEKASVVWLASMRLGRESRCMSTKRQECRKSSKPQQAALAR
jgi:hypothetical protein